ncbi:MAG TPA: hypothetical protein ENN96_02255, partial [Candidatus Acetothermia bacterium]|nr:hypothetical protein [Candidatus Acetothermia bacterium]
MKLILRSLILVLILGLSSTLWAQVPLPDTGKFSWEFYQAAMAGKTKRAAGQDVPVVSALLVTQEPATEDTLLLLESLGYTIVGTAGRFVQVQAPIDLFVDPIAGVGSVEFIVDVDFPPVADVMPPIGDIDAEAQGGDDEPRAHTSGTLVINADKVWESGHAGQGTKIAVIEWGYDTQNTFLSNRVPAPVYYSIRPVRQAPYYEAILGNSGSSDPDDREHGSACAMIAADVAPHAEIYLLSVDAGLYSLYIGWLRALEFAVRELEVDVVTTQIGWVDVTSGADGTGPLFDEIDRILARTNTLVTIAAGNHGGVNAAAHTGPGSASTWAYSASFVEDAVTARHVFDPGIETLTDRTSLWFTASAGDRVTILLEWDDWRTATRTVDLDLYLYDAKYATMPVAVRLAKHLGNTAKPVESLRRFVIPYTGTFAVVVENRGHKADDLPLTDVQFRLYFWNHDSSSRFEHHTKCGIVREVAASGNPQVIAVGAVDQDDLLVRTYSAGGPTFDGRQKP